MKNLFLTAATAVILAACGAQNPNDGAQQYDANTSLNTAPATGTTGTDAAAMQPANTGGISNNQVFANIKQQETIESDKARLEALKSTYQQVDPNSVQLPVQTSSGINLAAYALKQTNAVGEQIYRRSSFGISGCPRFKGDGEAAQRAFLQAGGPVRDRRGLDRDGDGFACNWDPDFYRKMLPGNG